MLFPRENIRSSMCRLPSNKPSHSHELLVTQNGLAVITWHSRSVCRRENFAKVNTAKANDERKNYIKHM